MTIKELVQQKIRELNPELPKECRPNCLECKATGFHAELHLEHLFLAVQRADNPFQLEWRAGMCGTLFVRDMNMYPAMVGVKTAKDELMKRTGGRHSVDYNLSQTFEENLDNPEVCNFLYELLVENK